MVDSSELFDSDMIENSLINYNPMKGIKNKIPLVDKYRPRVLDEIVQQDEVIKVLKESLATGEFPHMILYGAPGTGKCTEPSTPIVCSDGTIKQAQHIKTGDKLLGDDNTFRTVLSTTTGEDVMYKIIQGKGDDYTVNSEHIICLKLSIPFIEYWVEKERRYILKWFENHEAKQKSFTINKNKPLPKIIRNKPNSPVMYDTKEQAYEALTNYKNGLIATNKINKKGDICEIAIKNYIKKPVKWKHAYKGFKCDRITCWEKKTVELDPYMLGYWLGDGNTDDNRIKTQDSTVLSYFKNQIPKLGGNQFRSILKKYKLFNNKHVPSDYKINDVETRLQLLAGFLDADGHLSSSNNYEFCQKSKKIFDDIIFVARSLGLMASVGKSKIIDGTEYYRANIYGTGIEDIPTKIPRKEAKEYKHNKDSAVYKIKVKELPKGKYCGFELDGNGRFLLGDFTVTHNTSSALAFAMQLFGPKIFDKRVIELNASDERGINVVRNKIITFAKSAIGNPDPDYPCPPYKIIILDEADAMTMEAQSALRTVMESLSNITRFCFICNYINQIIDPIASRCMKFRFKSIDTQTMSMKLHDIAKKENFQLPEDVLEKIVELAKGDIRSGIITLQYMKYIYDYQKSISVKDIYETTNYLPMQIIKDIWYRTIENKTSTIIDIKKEALFLKQKGYSVNTIMEFLNRMVISCDKLNDQQKSLITLNTAKSEKRLIDGADEYIQLFNVLAYIHGTLRNKITIK